MTAAAKEGLIYICNPNNPTASITPKNELSDFIAKAAAPDDDSRGRSLSSLRRQSRLRECHPADQGQPNLIVARTFSKIYGMAGLRCGYCIAQREIIERMRPHQSWDSVNVLALAAAIASLNDPDQVTNGRRLNSEARAFVIGELDEMGYNKFLRRPTLSCSM